MKIVFFAILITILLVTGCSNDDAANSIEQNNFSDNSNSVVNQVIDYSKEVADNSKSDVVVIKDRLFIQQCNDIYLNPDDYMGKTIKWEGIYREATNPETNETFKFVIRYGPGCCGNDGTAGFEVLYDGETPKMDDWVEAVGQIEMVEQNGSEFVAIRLSKLTVLDVRGQETVTN